MRTGKKPRVPVENPRRLTIIIRTLYSCRSIRRRQIFSRHLGLERAKWCHSRSCQLLSPCLSFSSMSPVEYLIVFFSLVIPTGRRPAMSNVCFTPTAVLVYLLTSSLVKCCSRWIQRTGTRQYPSKPLSRFSIFR